MLFFVFEKFTKFRKYVGMFGILVKQIVIFNIGFEFCVFDSIWDHRLKIFFDPPKIENKSRIMVLGKIQNSAAGAAEFRILNFAIS